MGADDARAFFNRFVDHVKKTYQEDKVQTGEFQAYMNVELQNDGPVTLIMDTDEYDGAVDYVRKQLEKAEKCRECSSGDNVQTHTSLIRNKRSQVLQNNPSLQNSLFSKTLNDSQSAIIGEGIASGFHFRILISMIVRATRRQQMVLLRELEIELCVEFFVVTWRETFQAIHSQIYDFVEDREVHVATPTRQRVEIRFYQG